MTANVQTIIAHQAAKIVAEGLPPGPRLYPCVCGAGRHAHSGKAGVGKCEETKCKRYRADRVWTMVYAAIDADGMSVGDSLREYDRREREKHYKANPRGEGEWSIGASDTATCPRKIEYRNRPPEDFEPAPEDQREARMGTIIHNEVTRWMKALYPWRMFDLPVQIAGLDRKSALDMYDPITGVVTDFKTAGDWRWDQLGEDGPEWEVWEQVLLYALALVEAGYYVTRVRLVYVKRCNGHDENFEMDYDAPSAEQARNRLLGFAEALDRGESLPKTGTGPSTDALCRRCLAAETEVITDRGVKRIGDIVGERVHILDGNGGWIEVEAKAFGVQPLMRVTLRRRGVEKVVHATPDHGWFVADRPAPSVTECPECGATEGKNGPFQSTRAVRQHMAAAGHPAAPRLPDRTRVRVGTQDLQPGDWLTAVRAQPLSRTGTRRVTPAPVGIQHGFVYGDGHRGSRRNEGSYATFHGAKDETVYRHWFPNHIPRRRTDGARTIGNLPRYFKGAPPMDESASYLYGFLAGYFAADGCVDKRGRCTMSSASRESLDLVRDIAFRLGIGVGPIRTAMRIGRSGGGRASAATPLHTISLDGRTLAAEFFLVDHHRERWQANVVNWRADAKHGRWQVVEVEETDRIEETYCFEVPTTHSFVLADNLLTSNCFARNHCWNIPKAEALGRSPENLTILGEHPDDEQIAWAIQQKVVASTARLEAEKIEKERKALVDGIPPGRYGPDGVWEAWEIPKAGLPLYKDSFEQVREYLRLPPEMQPDPDEVHPIRGRGRIEHKVGKVRKATLDAERKRRKAEEQQAALEAAQAAQAGG